MAAWATCRPMVDAAPASSALVAERANLSFVLRNQKTRVVRRSDPRRVRSAGSTPAPLGPVRAVTAERQPFRPELPGPEKDQKSGGKSGGAFIVAMQSDYLQSKSISLRSWAARVLNPAHVALSGPGFI